MLKLAVFVCVCASVITQCLKAQHQRRGIAQVASGSHTGSHGTGHKGNHQSIPQIHTQVGIEHHGRHIREARNLTVLIGKDQRLDHMRWQGGPQVQKSNRTEEHPTLAKFFL